MCGALCRVRNERKSITLELTSSIKAITVSALALDSQMQCSNLMLQRLALAFGVCVLAKNRRGGDEYL